MCSNILEVSIHEIDESYYTNLSIPHTICLGCHDLALSELYKVMLCMFYSKCISKICLARDSRLKAPCIPYVNLGNIWFENRPAKYDWIMMTKSLFT